MLTCSFDSQQAHARKAQKPLVKISLEIVISGDLNETYQFVGALGERLVGSPAKPDSVCEMKALFREVIYNQKRAIEIWLDLMCAMQGQKTQMKSSRFFIDLKGDSQIVELSYFTEKIKKLKLEIKDLVLKPSRIK